MSVTFRQPDGTDAPVIPPELCVLVSDSLEAPATFLVVQHLVLALKGKRRCVLVGVAQSYEYYAAVLRKQGVQLRSERDKGNFGFVDGASLLLEQDPLQNIWQCLEKLTETPCLVFIDELTCFAHTGLDPLALLKWHRKLVAHLRGRSSSLLCVYHDDAFSPGRANIERSPHDSFLLRNLIQLSDIWIQTRSIRAQMTGELVVHRAPALLGNGAAVRHSLSKPLQYRLEETGAVYFAKGTGRGFL